MMCSDYYRPYRTYQWREIFQKMKKKVFWIFWSKNEKKIFFFDFLVKKFFFGIFWSKNFKIYFLLFGKNIFLTRVHVRVRVYVRVCVHTRTHALTYVCTRTHARACPKNQINLLSKYFRFPVQIDNEFMLWLRVLTIYISHCWIFIYNVSLI